MVIRPRRLRPYQKEGIHFLRHNPCAGIFADMGLGKTAIVLHALLDLPRPVLLIGPIRVIENVWMQEAKLWPATRGLTFSLLRGSPEERAAALEVDADIYLVNPELMHEPIDNKRFKTLIVDESTMFADSTTNRFKYMRQMLHHFGTRIILTGTPRPNSLLNLWGQIYLLDQGARLGTHYTHFQHNLFEQDDYNHYKWKPLDGVEEDVAELISDIVMRIDAKDHLPPRQVIHNQIYLDLPPKAFRQYKAMEREKFTELLRERTVSAVHAGAAIMKLRQMASGFVYDDDKRVAKLHDEKIKATAEILDETSSPVILIYAFKHELSALKKSFPYGVEFSSGIMEPWNKGRVPLLFLHPQSAGHGLNLQYGGHTMIIFSAQHSNGLMAQVMARIDRQGQENPVVFHRLIAKGTVDELILEENQQREARQNYLLHLVKKYAQAHYR